MWLFFCELDGELPGVIVVGVPVPLSPLIPNISWVLGGERFKVKVESKTGVSGQRIGAGRD